MSDLLLLKEKHNCPICGRDIKNLHLPTNCRTCGMLLFYGYQDFEKYDKETGWREYYVYFQDGGWKHRTHIFDFDGKPVTGNTGLSRNLVSESDTSPKTAKERIAQVRKEVKEKQKWYLSQKKKIRSFGK